MVFECKIIVMCLGVLPLSLKWKSHPQDGPESAGLVVLAVACPREPNWAWLPTRLPFGIAADAVVC